MLALDPVEHAVDEPARLGRPELLGDLDGLVDGRPWAARRAASSSSYTARRRMLRSTTAMRSRSQCSAYCAMSWSILPWCCLVPRTSDVGERAGVGVDRMPRPELVLVRHRIAGARGGRAGRGTAARPPEPLRRLPITRRRTRRRALVERAHERRHLERGLGGLLAPVADVAARALPRLLLGERGDHAEGRGHAGVERDALDAGRRLPGHEVEVRRLALDHAAHADDRPRSGRSAPGAPRGLRQLERARHPVHVDRARPAHRRRPARRSAPDEQPLGDALVEAGGHDREARPSGRLGRSRWRTWGATGHAQSGSEVSRVAELVALRTQVLAVLADSPALQAAPAPRPAGRSPRGPRRLVGLLVSSRRFLSPRSTRIWAPMP